MPLNVRDLDTWHAYVEGVMAKSDHHAPHIGHVILGLGGFISWRAEPGSLKVMHRSGEIKNVLWWKSESTGNSYVLAYNPRNKSIEVRDDTLQGVVVYSLTSWTAPDLVDLRSL